MTLLALALIICLSAYVVVAISRQLVADRDFHPIKVAAPLAPPAHAATALTQLAATPAIVETPVAAAAPTPSGIQRALAATLVDPALGSQPAVEVTDLATRSTLLSQRATASMAPASTAKLLLATAVLTVRKATDRFTTTVVAGRAPGSVVLVGGGDPTLTAAAVGAAAAYRGAARISDLASQLKQAGVQASQILVDDSLFSGPETAPGWGTEDAPSEYASPIVAAMVDGGRAAPSDVQRSATPDLAAGQALAAALGAPSTPVSLGAAAVGGSVLARVSSAPVGTLVEEMLDSSDDVIAEVLGRQVALAARQPASFAGAVTAVRSVLAGLGIEVGSGMADASGLSVLDRLSAATLTSVLTAVLDPARAGLRPILAGLPVAGWDGTLADRYPDLADRGRGLVRAKTGSLGDQGVSTEAGVVTDADGRQLIFVLMASGAPDLDRSRVVLDAAASRLAQCGCR